MPSKKYSVKLQKIHFLRLMFAVSIWIFSILLCFTIIGILPAIGLIAMATALMGRNIKCPNCKNPMLVLNNKPSMKCKECSDLITFEWIK